MYVLVNYDVNTETPAGRKRLRHIANTCLDFGQPVQHSVFELKVDPGQWTECKNRLESIIDGKTGSLRYYYLGRNWQRREELQGAKPSIDPDVPLIA